MFVFLNGYVLSRF